MGANGTSLSPKQVMASTASKTGVFETVGDPLVAEVRSGKKEAAYYNQAPVVPFLEGGDIDLKLLDKLSNLSPTHSAAINSIRRYVTGGQMEVVSRKVEGFARRPDQKREVEAEDFEAYVEWLKGWNSPGKLFRAINRIYDNFSRFGNAYIEVVLYTIGGEKSADLHVHDADRCLYLATFDQMPRIVLVSPYWYTRNIYKEEPKAVPLYPNFVTDEFGSQRTMIHLRYEVAGREWYGIPSWLAGIYSAYMEVQSGQYGVEGYAGNFIGQVFFETFEGFGGGDGEEEPYTNPTEGPGGIYREGPQGFNARMKEFFTNAGSQKQWFVHRNSPADAEPTKVHQFQANTNEKYHEAMARLSEAQLLKVHDWSPVLMGVKTPGQLGATTEFKDAFRQKWKTVIKPYQDLLMDPVNLICGVVANWLQDEGLELTSRLSLGLVNLYSDLLREEAEIEEGPSSNGGNKSVEIEPENPREE